MLKGVARVWFNSESFQTIPTFHSIRVRFHSESKNRKLRTRNRPSLSIVHYSSQLGPCCVVVLTISNMTLRQIKTNIVNGIPFPILVDQAKYDALIDFPLRSDDFFLATHAKSGTTWLQQISKLIKIKGEKTSADDEDKHIFETCPWFEVIGKEAAMVSRIYSI